MMKGDYRLIGIVITCLLLLGSCTKESDRFCDRNVDITLIAIPEEGGTIQKEFIENGPFLFLRLTAIPNDGYVFSKWSGSAGGLGGHDNPKTLTICPRTSSVKSVNRTAFFEKLE